MEQDPKSPRAADQLRAWLEKTGTKITEFAAAVGRSPAAVHGWLNGSYRPEYLYRLKIATVTGGVISAESWLSDEESESLAHTPVIARTAEG